MSWPTKNFPEFVWSNHLKTESGCHSKSAAIQQGVSQNKQKSIVLYAMAGKAKPLKKPKSGGKELDEDDIALQK